AIAVAIEAEADVGLVFEHGPANGVQHLHVFRIGIVPRKIEIEITIERHHLAANSFEHARCPRARRAIAAGGDYFEPAREPSSRRERPDVAIGQIRNKYVAAAWGRFALAGEDEVLERGHLLWSEGKGSGEPHLDAGPAIVVVAGRDHRHPLHV